MQSTLNDNALAETVIGLYKTDVIRNQGPWRGLDEVELATLEWVRCFNHHRLLGSIGHVPPAGFEEVFLSHHSPHEEAVALTQTSLR